MQNPPSPSIHSSVRCCFRCHTSNHSVETCHDPICCHASGSADHHLGSCTLAAPPPTAAMPGLPREHTPGPCAGPPPGLPRLSSLGARDGGVVFIGPFAGHGLLQDYPHRPCDRSRHEAPPQWCPRHRGDAGSGHRSHSWCRGLLGRHASPTGTAGLTDR